MRSTLGGESTCKSLVAQYDTEACSLPGAFVFRQISIINVKINSLMWRETSAIIYNLADAKLRIEVTEVMFTTVKVAASCIRDLSFMALKVSTWYSCEISE